MTAKEQYYPCFREGDPVQQDTDLGVRDGRVVNVDEVIDGRFIYTVKWLNGTVEVHEAGQLTGFDYLRNINYQINGQIDELRSLFPDGSIALPNTDLEPLLEQFEQTERSMKEWLETYQHLKWLTELRMQSIAT